MSQGSGGGSYRWAVCPGLNSRREWLTLFICDHMHIMRISRLSVLFIDWIAVRIYRLLRVYRFAIFMVGE